MKHEPSEVNGKRKQTTRRTLSLGLLSLCLVIIGSGCKRDAKVAADNNPGGTYALASVDGNNVPCSVKHGGHALAVKSGSFIINSNGTCSSKVVFGPPSGGDVAREVKATYTRQGQRLTMQWEGAGTTMGSVEGDTFTMNNEGMVFVYRK
jgi:hypothetical protein